MTEEEFIASIDCQFPYDAPREWRRSIALARNISPNAVFMVIHELCRPPRSSRVSAATRLRIYRCVQQRFKHPLLTRLDSLFSTAISGGMVPVSRAGAAMRQVARYRDQYNALAICYFSCNDRLGRTEALYDAITAEWSNARRVWRD
jgi:hypothetical protein